MEKKLLSIIMGFIFITTFSLVSADSDETGDSYFKIYTEKFSVPDMKNFSFKSKESKIIKGISRETSNGCRGPIIEEDTIGALTLAALFYQNSCYTDGRYNNKDYKVQWGVVRDSEGKFSFDAYKIHEPSHKATKFLASRHAIFYKFKNREDYSVYTLNDGSVEKVKEIKASKIVVGKYTKMDGLTVSNQKGSKIYFFAPSKTKVSIYTKLSKNGEAARVSKKSILDVLKFKYSIDKISDNDKKQYRDNGRQFFLMRDNTQRLTVIWQDKKDNSIFHTKIENDFNSQKTKRLKNYKKAKLIAVTKDNKDNYYYLTVRKQKYNRSSDFLTMYKINRYDKLIKKQNYDTSKRSMNIYSFGNYMADLEYSNKKLALIIGRTMFKSSDGLNHQGAIAVVFDAESLKLLKNKGQTSGHSFDNYLTKNSKKEFLAIDLGDNYPRGINMHKLTDKMRRSRVVYTFKTHHGTRPKSPAGRRYPYYSKISRGGQKYYKWSNDNGVYSSLGAVIEGRDGYIVIFTGEPDKRGNSINNSRVGKSNKDPRNVGFLKVRKDFEKASGRGNVVTDDLVLSKGKTETGGFYTFGGAWAPQRNAGVMWLTKYRSLKKESAFNLKAVKLMDGNILILWEKYEKTSRYSRSYVATYAMKIDQNGKKISKIINLGSNIRLNRRDEILSVGSKVFIASVNSIEKKLELTVFEMR